MEITDPHITGHIFLFPRGACSFIASPSLVAKLTKKLHIGNNTVLSTNSFVSHAIDLQHTSTRFTLAFLLERIHTIRRRENLAKLCLRWETYFSSSTARNCETVLWKEINFPEGEKCPTFVPLPLALVFLWRLPNWIVFYAENWKMVGRQLVREFPLSQMFASKSLARSAWL